MNINSAPFLTVTYRVFQLCDENKFQLHEAFMDFSCSSDGSGIIVLKFEHQHLYINTF